MEEERIWTVTGDDEFPTNLKVVPSLAINKTIWWVGYAKDPQDALSKCIENLKANYPQYAHVLI